MIYGPIHITVDGWECEFRRIEVYWINGKKNISATSYTAPQMPREKFSEAITKLVEQVAP